MRRRPAIAMGRCSWGYMINAKRRHRTRHGPSYCRLTGRLLTRGLSFQPTPSNFTQRQVFKFHWSNIRSERPQESSALVLEAYLLQYEGPCLVLCRRFCHRRRNRGGDTGDMYPLTHGEEDKPRIYSCPPQSHAYASSIYHSKSTQGEKGNLVVHNSRKPFGDRGSSTEPAVELQRSPAPVAGEEGAGCPLSQTPLPLISIPYMQTVCNT